MEEDQDELRFICRMCDKKYPSGKSLGGHMRSHMIAAATTTATTAAATATNSSESEDNGNNPNAYGLRENPKKTWRAVDSSHFPYPNEKICKQCGKGFQSLKALCGHMACHSEKDRNFKDYDHSWTSENLDHDEKVVAESFSDDDEPEFNQDPTRVTRSKSKRFMKLVVKPYSINYNYNEELDQEEVAMVLMMLSKDSGNWAGVNSVNSVVETSENNSAEIKSGKNEESETFSIEEWLRNDKNKKLKLSYEEKLEIKRNLFNEIAYRESLRKRTRFEDDSFNESSKKRNKYECLNCNKVFTSFQGLGGHRPCHKRNNNIFGSKTENGENGLEGEFGHNRKAKYDIKIKAKKSKGHECPICFRMFKSGQALGGHKRSHFLNRGIDHFAGLEHEGPSGSDMIDLNLPAPEED